MASDNGRTPDPLAGGIKTSFADFTEAEKALITAAVNDQFNMLWDIVQENWTRMLYSDGIPLSYICTIMVGDNYRVYKILRLQISIHLKLLSLLPHSNSCNDSEPIMLGGRDFRNVIESLADPDRNTFVSLHRKIHKFEKVCDQFEYDSGDRRQNARFARDYNAENDDDSVKTECIPSDEEEELQPRDDLEHGWKNYKKNFRGPATVVAKSQHPYITDVYQKLIADHWHVTKANGATPNQLTTWIPQPATISRSTSSPSSVDTRRNQLSHVRPAQGPHDDEPPAQRRRIDPPSSLQHSLSASGVADAAVGESYDALARLPASDQAVIDSLEHYMTTLPADRAADIARRICAGNIGHHFADAAQ